MAGIWERTVGWGACAVAVALLIAALLGARVEAAADLSFHGATVRLAAVPGRPAAGYFRLDGGPATLVAVTSPLAERVELHTTTTTGGVMRMAPLATTKVSAGAPLTFAPGGNHLMIFGLQGVTPGGTVPLLFRFADGRTVRVAANAVAAGAAMEMHGAH